MILHPVRTLLLLLFAGFQLPLLAQKQIDVPDIYTLNVPAPMFIMHDINGKSVHLLDYKGKVLILTFWATWCAPCHRAFPAMQQVVKHYANDTNVVFLFADTRENLPDYKRSAQEDMSKHHYDFKIVYDETDADGNQSKYLSLFGSHFIPAKYIIDRNGIIRYQWIGYNGKNTDEEAAAKLIQLIDVAGNK